MERPALKLPTYAQESFAGLTYYIDGELVPALTVELDPQSSIFFEHHILLWKETTINVGVRPIKGAFSRMLAGMQIFITEAQGPGQIAFSRDGTGHIIAMHLQPGEELHVREHQFLAATTNLEYSYERVKGIGNILFSGTGFFVDRFRAIDGEAILWLHGYGNIFEKVLAEGEQIDVEPGAWFYKDPSVRMEVTMQRLATGLLAGTTMLMNRFIGPGRVGLQTLYVHMNPKDDRTQPGSRA